ncbi:hypothetical protein [Paenibacillus sp. KS-LC4]|uniref:hypothetical protein n=1 Tax=Paenibacillus sp. KS-LC4 TaxID=2979727 RepID=UPI0030D4A510
MQHGSSNAAVSHYFRQDARVTLLAKAAKYLAASQGETVVVLLFSSGRAAHSFPKIPLDPRSKAGRGVFEVVNDCFPYLARLKEITIGLQGENTSSGAALVVYKTSSSANSSAWRS